MTTQDNFNKRASADSVRKGFQLLNALRTGGASVSPLLDLIRDGASVVESDEKGRTALMLAAGNEEYADVARALIDAGADVNARDNYQGLTVVMHCVQGDQDKVLECLIAKGADINATDDAGRTALMLGVATRLSFGPMGDGSLGSLKCIDVMIDNGVNLNAQCRDGFTATLRAAMVRHIWVAGRLIAAGADASIANVNGATVNAVLKHPAEQKQLQEAIEEYRPSAVTKQQPKM